jgi:hypothetical protein
VSKIPYVVSLSLNAYQVHGAALGHGQLAALGEEGGQVVAASGLRLEGGQDAVPHAHRGSSGAR